jgi:hypothetical protein
MNIILLILIEMRIIRVRHHINEGYAWQEEFLSQSLRFPFSPLKLTTAHYN